ncbi:MAG: amidohydrolase [Streptosporangiales bacterium]|nr:amidohydrolase [Streptosporangiales bacterium]
MTPQPSTAYLDALYATTARRVATAEPLSSPHGGAPEAVTAALAAAVTRDLPELVALSHDVHDHPEVAYEEHHAVAAVAELLRRHGHRVEVGAYGIPTALRATAGGGDGPRVAVVAKYDALPGIGHACGHNVICASAVGAWLALAEQVGTLGGTVELLGTPAEEGGGGKVHMLAAGAFDGVDAAVMVHPFSYDVATHPFLGRRAVDVTYHGVAAHAAAMPFMGRNALDAAVTAYQGVAALRQHLPSSDRVHGIVTDGGHRPNVVPARAALQYYARSAGQATLDDLCNRLHEVFLAAAGATGTTAEVDWDPVPPYLPITHNHTLAARWAHHLGDRGRTVLPDGVVPETLVASTDFGNVSAQVPGIHPMLAVAPPEVSLHTEEFARCARGSEGDRGVADGAVGLACTVADFLADAELRAAVRAEFDGDA